MTWKDLNLNDRRDVPTATTTVLRLTNQRGGTPRKDLSFPYRYKFMSKVKRTCLSVSFFEAPLPSSVANNQHHHTACTVVVAEQLLEYKKETEKGS
jgi:hypothetical protein